MISIEEIAGEISKIGNRTDEHAERMNYYGELALELMRRVQSDFSDQQAGKTLINALSLINVSCHNAACVMNGIKNQTAECISQLKK